MAKYNPRKPNTSNSLKAHTCTGINQGENSQLNMLEGDDKHDKFFFLSFMSGKKIIQDNKCEKTCFMYLHKIGKSIRSVVKRIT